MDAVSTLLKCLKSKRYISDIEKAKAEVSTERITLRKEDDLLYEMRSPGMEPS